VSKEGFGQLSRQGGRVLLLLQVWEGLCGGPQALPSTNIKYIRSPCRVDHYKGRHTTAHPKRWNEYQEHTNAEKLEYCEGGIRRVKILLAHVEGDCAVIREDARVSATGKMAQGKNIVLTEDSANDCFGCCGYGSGEPSDVEDGVSIADVARC
jgi:hypothetical protein